MTHTHTHGCHGDAYIEQRLNRGHINGMEGVSHVMKCDQCGALGAHIGAIRHLNQTLRHQDDYPFLHALPPNFNPELGILQGVASIGKERPREAERQCRETLTCKACGQTNEGREANREAKAWMACKVL